jgi:hypothetical protein
MNLKLGQLKLSNLRNKRKKKDWRKSEQNVRHLRERSSVTTDMPWMKFQESPVWWDEMTSDSNLNSFEEIKVSKQTNRHYKR